MSLIVSLGGNIGAGKSMLVLRLKTCENLGVVVFLEPSSKSNQMLALFYTDPGKFSAPMQFYTLFKRIMIMLEVYQIARDARKEGRPITIVVERSFPEDWEFVIANNSRGCFPTDAYEDYEKIIQSLLGILPLPNAFVMLDVPPKTCIERIHERGRLCEQGIDEPYLQAIQDACLELESKVASSGSEFIHLDWRNYGDENTFLDAIRNVPRREMNFDAAIEAIGRPPPEVSGKDEPATGFLKDLWVLFLKYLDNAGYTVAQMEAAHEQALRESANAVGNTHLDV